MKWKIKLSGDKKYLDDLASVLETLNFVDPRIRKEKEGESEEFFLEGTIFENINDAKEVVQKAKTFLTLMSMFLCFKTQRVIETQKIAEIECLCEDNKKNIYDSEGNLTIQEITQENGSVQRNVIIRVNSVEIKLSVPKVTVTTSGDEIPNFESLDEIKTYIDQNANDPVKMNKVKQCVCSKLASLETFVSNFSSDSKIVEIRELKTVIDAIVSLKSKISGQPEVGTGLEIAEWASLYRIYEIIAYDVGGAGKDHDNEETLKTKNWVEPTQIEDFSKTSNYYYRHSAKRLLNPKHFPERKMSLSEAEEVISTLLSKYIEFKVKNNIP